MLDVIEVIKDKYVKEGEIKNSREMVLTVLSESLGVIPANIREKVMNISHTGVLNDLVRQAVRCKEVVEFENMLNRAAA